MGDLLLNLDELTSRHNQTILNRTQIFNDILVSCHNRIKKYSMEFKKNDCLFEPPVFVLGKPPYNYLELTNFIINALRKNGLRAEWLANKRAIYISWKKDDIDITQYRNHATQFNTDLTQNYSIVSIQPPSGDTTTKRKTKSKNTPALQHLAVLEYRNGVKDYVPINIKGI